MSGRIKGCLLGGLLLYALIAVIALLVAANRRENYESPATASRDVFGFRDGHFGLLEKSNRETETAWPADKPMSTPERTEGADSTFLLDWSKEAQLAPPPDAERWVDVLAGDDRVEFVAFASWVPQPGDPYQNRDWTVSLTLRNPKTGEALTPEELQAAEVPETFRSFSPPRRYQTPLLRLVFKTHGMAYPRAIALSAGDSRTGAQVSYDLQDENDGSARRETSGDWLRMDTDLLLWHDTPLTCHVQFLTGEPILAELKREKNAQILVGDNLRVQWLGTTAREIKVNTWMEKFEPSPSLPADQQESIRRKQREHSLFGDRIFGVSPDPEGSSVPRALVRVSSPDLIVDHCGLATSDGIQWLWENEETDETISIASIPLMAPGAEPLRLVYLPQVCELTFEIAALPDMPNPRDTSDLFDVVLPRITLPEDLDDAETQLLGFIGVGAQIAWKSNERWDDHPPKDLPPDNTFINTSPQALLDWYLNETSGAWVRYDPDNLILHISEDEKSWWERMKERLESLVGSP